VSIATQPTPHVSARRPDVPKALDDLIARAMAKDATTRVATAAELRDGLVSVRDELTNPRPAPVPGAAHDWWRLTLTAAAIGALALISWFVFRPVPGAVTPATISLAPIVSATSDDPELDEIGVLLGSVLSRNLAALPGVTIVAPDLAQGDSPGPKTAPTAGPSPPRAYSVTLTIRRKGSGLVANGTLTRQGESRPVWDQEFEGEALGVLRFATTNLATAFERDLALGRVLTGEQRTRLQRLPTVDAQAVASYLRGRVVLDTATDRAADDQAAAAYATAIERDATFAEAHSGLAQAFLSTQRHASAESGWRDKAKDAAAKAVALDPLSDQAHVASAFVSRELRQKDDALLHAQRAVALNPSGDDGHRALGLALIDAGKADLGFVALRQAVSLRPRHWANPYALGIAQLRGGRPREAVDQLRRTLELRKDFQAGNVNLAVAYLRLDEWALSVGHSQRALELQPRDAYALNNLGTAYYWDSRFTRALESFQAAVREEPTAIRYMNLGDTYQRLGRMAEAKQAYLDAIDLADKQLANSTTYSAGTAAVAAKCEAKLGRTAIAETRALAALTADKDNDEVVYKLAVVYALAGRIDKSLDSLERAVGLGYSRALVRRDPDLQSLRNDPRFKALVTQKDQ
jgi:tetratricopeptide (TPR) repeat protein